MARRRLIEFEAILLLGCALLLSRAAGRAFHGHPYDAKLRRGLAEAGTRQVFDVTQYGAVANNDRKDNVQVS